jgi:SAM-dependent methyltransferase
MDSPDVDSAELARSLADLRAVNRWLGGRRSALRLVLRLARRVPGRPVRVLDVGTGSADLPLELTRAARLERLPLRVTGLDVHPTTVSAAKAATVVDPDVEIIEGDALALPFPAGDFDIAICNTILHHFETRAVAAVLSEMDRVSRWGIVVTDLARSKPALIGANLLAATVWRAHPITRHDGPVSVRAAFTPAELSKIASAALGRTVRARPAPIFRLTLVVDGTPDWERPRDAGGS